MEKKNKKGFTLVELVIVIAVIAILAGVMITTFSSVVTSAQQSADFQEVKAQMDEKLFVFIADNAGQYPNCFVSSSDLSGAHDVDDVEFEYIDFDAFLDASTSTTTEGEENADSTSTAILNATGGTAYYKLDNSSIATCSDGDYPDSNSHDVGTYYKVDYSSYTPATTGESQTNATWTVTSVTKMVVATSSENTDSNTAKKTATTYYATTAKITGRNEANITLKFDATTGNYVAEIEK